MLSILAYGRCIPPSRLRFRMNQHDTHQDGPEPRQANGAGQDRRYARRIDCTERPRGPQSSAPATSPAPPRDDAHR